jgi:hypothetical protein
LHGVEDLRGAWPPVTFIRSFVPWAHFVFPLPGG